MSDKRDDLVYLGHMLDTAQKAMQFVSAKSHHDFAGDEVLRIALAHLLQTIGEAARRVSDDFQRAHSDIPWSQIIGMRHKVVHDYMVIDDDIVWATVTDYLPQLIASITILLDNDQ
jgi:uncharacterized protein with HEPN domain